jgi:hypothetical protein
MDKVDYFGVDVKDIQFYLETGRHNETVERFVLEEKRTIRERVHSGILEGVERSIASNLVLNWVNPLRRVYLHRNVLFGTLSEPNVLYKAAVRDSEAGVLSPAGKNFLEKMGKARILLRGYSPFGLQAYYGVICEIRFVAEDCEVKFSDVNANQGLRAEVLRNVFGDQQNAEEFFRKEIAAQVSYRPAMFARDGYVLELQERQERSYAVQRRDLEFVALRQQTEPAEEYFQRLENLLLGERLERVQEIFNP